MRKAYVIQRRDLPHWQLDGATYFITWRMHASQRELSPTERDLVVDALRFFNGLRYYLSAYVVMNDHVHVIVKPADDIALSSITHSWKSYTSHQMCRNHDRSSPVWEPESYDHIIRDGIEFRHLSDYVRNNPKKRWPHTTDYRWVWIQEDRADDGGW